MNNEKPITVTIRWLDSYLEIFECDEVRSGYAFLWMRLTNGQERTVPLGQVRWFSRFPESHAPRVSTPRGDQASIQVRQ